MIDGKVYGYPTKEDYENFFLSIARLEYNGSDKSKCFNWIKENLGKESIIKIGDANLKLCNGTSGLPILTLYTDGNENYQKERRGGFSYDRLERYYNSGKCSVCFCF